MKITKRHHQSIRSAMIVKKTVSIFYIEVTAGLFDFSWNGPNRFWVFPDGSTSSAEHPARTLAEPGTVKLMVNSQSDWRGNYMLQDGDTNYSYVGTIRDLPPVDYSLIFNYTSMTGDLSDLPPISYNLSLGASVDITGDLSDISQITSTVNLYNCANITGDLSSLSNVNDTISLSGCPNITGDLSSLTVTLYLSLRGCNLVTGNIASLNTTYLLDLYGCSLITGSLNDLPPLAYLLDVSGCVNLTGATPSTVKATEIKLDNCPNIDTDSCFNNIYTSVLSSGKTGGIMSATGTAPAVTTASLTARTELINTYGWTLTYNT